MYRNTIQNASSSPKLKIALIMYFVLTLTMSSSRASFLVFKNHRNFPGHKFHYKDDNLSLRHVWSHQGFHQKLNLNCVVNNDNEDNNASINSNNNSINAQRLLDLAFQRADRTLSTKANNNASFSSSYDKRISTSSSSSSIINNNKNSAAVKSSKRVYMDKDTYKSQPAVTGTALAHLLWKSTLRPGIDSAIDATCGNGHDSLAIADMLFSDKDDNNHDLETNSELLCIDIQDAAVERTNAMLREGVSDNEYLNRIKVVQSSHAPLPIELLSSTESIGLVVYNLGWLPGTGPKNEGGLETVKVATQLHTTLTSISDACVALRVGGLLSVMTYPGTCEKEACAVTAFAEALAMFTTRSLGGWQKGVDEIEDDYVRGEVTSAVLHVHQTGLKGQAWRVFDHRPLGRASSPILVTAMRIK